MTVNLTLTDTPFRDAIGIEPLGSGRYRAELGPVWTVGERVHGGLLQVLLVRAGLARLASESASTALDPLAISTDFLHAPELGPVELHTEPLKIGRTVAVVSVRMVQADRIVLAATVTAGRLSDGNADWAELPEMPAVPPPDAVDLGQYPQIGSLARAGQLHGDPQTLGFSRNERGVPVIRGWARPRGEEPDVLFALLAGDALPPTVFNARGVGAGWAPTVQMTAFLRARPRPGWLRLCSRSTSVTGCWFDEETLVIDQAGRLICQSRQLALAPLPR